MSKKNKDEKNRWRNETIAFHVSHMEKIEIEKRVKLCGYMTKQDYVLENLLSGKVTAVGNPLMLVTFRKELRQIISYLKEGNTDEEALEEILIAVKRMLEILEAFSERNDT